MKLMMPLGKAHIHLWAKAMKHHGSNPMTVTLVKSTSQQGAVAPVTNFYYYGMPPSTFLNASTIHLSAFAPPYPIGPAIGGRVAWPGPLNPSHVGGPANTLPPPLLLP
ncbi:hypothetical protein CROQUDRAFT_133300 [Cronartium quercuum f. sp. fusiforme G11]|uniref:Uncharacterized protein n=1 Tax=Cronartium quercuum f. sp. fusiforme G11 TaxID=708437 RepID=A0A9P6NLA1_9BASI|nr:hypothetical protein CROQUDRAFT_133300 [Cronartium quercuum f. sp. fusiforme G11]